MSYILDALKRADQERKQGDIPDLRSISPATAGDAKRRNLLWPSLLIAAAAVALLWLRPWADSGLNTGMKAETNAAMSTAPLAANRMSAETEALPQSAPQLKVAPQPAAVQHNTAQNSTAWPVASEESAAPSESEIVDANANSATAVDHAAAESETVALPGVMELPSHIRNTLPNIKISGHIYDESPASRMVIINDKVMREGRYINDALSIEEITDSGIILNQNGTRFFMSTFDSWPR